MIGFCYHCKKFKFDLRKGFVATRKANGNWVGFDRHSYCRKCINFLYEHDRII